MWALLIIVIVLVPPQIWAKIYTENITDFSKCKVHYSRSESAYQQFYEIADESRENDTLLDLHFSVLAPSDAHILLSPSSKLQRSDPAYEIVLGAGGNMFSDIRRAQKAAVKASVRLKDLLSALDIRSFWLHISKDGLIEVGREGEELAFIAWRDPDPLPLKVFSFGTWPGVEAKWLFDCPREGNNVTVDSKEVERELTNLQRLRADLLTYYDPYVRPISNYSLVTMVTLKMLIFHVFLNEHRSSFSLMGSLKLEWNDEKMKWDPNKYGNIKSLRIAKREIWQPDLVLNNAVDMMGRDILDQTVMLVTNDGVVQWTPLYHMESWCDASDLGHWPSDMHTCKVYLGFANDFNYLELKIQDAQSFVLPNEDSNTEWHIFNVDALVLSPNSLPLNHSNFFNTHCLKLIFQLQRKSNVYTAVFFTPFLVVAVSMLATFWASPFGYLKISLVCLQLLIISIVLVNLAAFMPTHPQKVPYLVLLYSSASFASLACLLISIVVINLCRTTYKTPIPHFLWEILMLRPIQTILFLPKVTISSKYGKLDEISFTKQDENVQNSWILLGTAIDRIAFVTYLGLIIFGICVKY